MEVAAANGNGLTRAEWNALLLSRLDSIEEKLDAVKTKQDEQTGALGLAKYLGGGGFILAATALVGLILQVAGVIH